MSKPTVNAMERHDRMNREAAHVILADPNSIPLQVAWARAFVRRIGDEQQPENQQRTLAFDEVTPCELDADGRFNRSEIERHCGGRDAA